MATAPRALYEESVAQPMFRALAGLPAALSPVERGYIDGSNRGKTQYEPVRQLRLTGRGQTIGFHPVETSAIGGGVYMYSSAPIPFLALVRTLTTIMHFGTYGLQWRAWHATNAVLGEVLKVNVPAMTSLIPQICVVRAWGEIWYTVYANAVPITIPINFLMPSVDQRIILGCGNNGVGNAFGSFFFECLEVISD